MKMTVRLIKKDGKLLLLCADGTIKEVTDAFLKEFFVTFRTSEFYHGDLGMWSTEADNITKYPGKTLAYVNENRELCIVENPFIAVMQNLTDDEYITLHEYAERQGKNDNRIKALCRENRIPGAIKKAGKWFIPKHSPYPKDARYSGVEK